jgi:hypothetical protein
MKAPLEISVGYATPNNYAILHRNHGAVRVAEAQERQRVLRSVGRWEDKTT